jgi:uncharacterized membrane protein (DUF2068 family)
VDPNLRTCGRKGHATYRPDEAGLAERLHAETAIGTSWRCLRCGDFVVGEPAGSGPAADAPVLLRGKALRDATVLKLLAVERILRAILLIGVGYVVLRFRHSEGNFQALFNKAIPAAEPLARVLHFDLDHSPTIAKLRHLLHTSPHTLLLVALAVFGYAAINLVEATGLWLAKRWGEYFATVATSVFLPLEIYELNERVTFLRVTVFIINIAAIVYLIYSKRLFGARGGRRAFEAERHSESLLEVEKSADQPAGDESASDDQLARTTATDSAGSE